MWYFALFAGMWAFFWWPIVVIGLLIDTIYFTRASYLILSDQEEEEEAVGIILGVTFIIGLAIVHLFGIFDVVSFIYTQWDMFLKVVGSYLLIGLVYMTLRGIARILRFRKEVRQELIALKERFNDDPAEWEKKKAQKIEEMRPEASRHKGWMVAIVLLWLPDMVFRALFKWWVDGLRKFFGFCQTFIQKQVIDRLWVGVGKDI